MLSDIRPSATNEQILHDSTYIRHIEQSESARKQNGGFQGTGKKVYCLTGEKFHFGKIGNILVCLVVMLIKKYNW